MPRRATVRSASLSPTEAALADELAKSVADGSFTELVRLMLLYFGVPLREQLDLLRRNGIDPKERLFVTTRTPADGDAQVRDFDALSSWTGQLPRGS